MATLAAVHISPNKGLMLGKMIISITHVIIGQALSRMACHTEHRAQHEYHQHSKDVVAEYGKEANDWKYAYDQENRPVCSNIGMKVQCEPFSCRFKEKKQTI